MSCLPRSRRRPLKSTVVVAGAFTSALLLAACGAGDSTNAGSPGDTPRRTPSAGGQGCVSDYVEGTDYVGAAPQLKYAKNVAITAHGHYQVLTVKEPYPGAKPESYVLNRCGTPAPELTGDLAGAQVVEVPIDSMFSGSTTHLPLLVDLDQADLVTGVSNAGIVIDKDVRARIDAGKVVEYAPNLQIDTEKVIAAKPDLLMTGGTDDPSYATIRQAGVPVVANAEWLENTPLGRAEWVKVMGVLTGESDKAAKVFDQIDTDYAKVRTASQGTEPVEVLPGQMMQGTWYIPGGSSYVAALFKDANATYAWQDTPDNGSIKLDLEKVLAKAKNADVWIMSEDVASLGDVLKNDPRYGEFKAAASGNVWSNNALIGSGGGNAYWERGVTRPDLVLADLTTILHPKALPDHHLEFYRKLDK